MRANETPATDTWLANLRDERDGALLYEGLASVDPDAGHARTFRELARAERRHAAVWEKKLTGAGVAIPPERPSPRTRLLLWLARRFGTARVLPMVMQGEGGDAAKYRAQGGDAAALADEESAHGEALRAMAAGGAASSEASGDVRAAIADREPWHRGGGRGGSIRAAIFGMNDGLLSNLSLVLGVAGAGVAPHTLLLTGLAGLLAGACSMAVGEYTSVASQRDLLRRLIEQERREIAESPAEEQAELTAILRQKGLSAERARLAAADIFRDKAHALDTLVREELGLDPADLGSPLGAALSSLAMFSVGAAIPLLPFVLLDGTRALVASAALAAVVLGSVGALIGVLAGTSAWRSAARMLALGALAAAVTFGVGRLVGSNVG